jgi:hypothetical protein
MTRQVLSGCVSSALISNPGNKAVLVLLRVYAWVGEWVSSVCMAALTSASLGALARAQWGLMCSWTTVVAEAVPGQCWSFWGLGMALWLAWGLWVAWLCGLLSACCLLQCVECCLSEGGVANDSISACCCIQASPCVCWLGLHGRCAEGLSTPYPYRGLQQPVWTQLVWRTISM